MPHDLRLDLDQPVVMRPMLHPPEHTSGIPVTCAYHQRDRSKCQVQDKSLHKRQLRQIRRMGSLISILILDRYCPTGVALYP